jgi:predicted metal-dependent phosphoesterase TrpH
LNLRIPELSGVIPDNGTIEGITFGRPRIGHLREEGYSAVDMHYHTNHSDSPTTVRSTLKLARRMGVGVAITDHNAISGYQEAISMDTDVLIIPGIEVSSADGPHILLYFYRPRDMCDFYRKHVEPYKRKSPYLAIRMDSMDIVERAEGYGCVRVAAHPYGYLLFNKGLQKCVEAHYLEQEILEKFEGVEVVCGGMTRPLNIKAGELAERFGKGRTGGSDGHLLHDLGSVVTCAPSDNAEEFLGDIVERRSVVQGLEKTNLRKGAMGMIVATKYIRYTLPSLRIHYEQNVPRVRHFFKGLSGQKKP